ncbi:MAG: VanZ family protein [Defluviitaleaceae bacterium]|nr:VanZ family protein [Defluviitaleaceae bacterium]
MAYFYPILLTFFRTVPEVDFWIPFMHILIITFWLYIIIQSFYTKTIPKWTVYLSYTAYFSVLGYLLFFMTVGASGFETHLFSFFSDFFTRIAFLNIMMFVPFGFLFMFNTKKVVYFVVGITIVEIIQYVFALGIFDLADIIGNTLGFIVGMFTKEMKFFQKIESYVR